MRFFFSDEFVNIVIKTNGLLPRVAQITDVVTKLMAYSR